MVDANKLVEFVENYCLHYGIENRKYFLESDDGWFCDALEDNEITEEVIREMLLLTGLSREELLGMKKETMEKYYHRYCFFNLDREFDHLYGSDSRFLYSEKVAGLFYNGIAERYNTKEIKGRAFSKAVKLQNDLTGISHGDSIPICFSFSTEGAFSFPRYRDLIMSLFHLVKRYKELFLMTLKHDLSDDEINEMNFLASCLDVRDRVQREIRLHYGNVVKLRHVYRTEKLKDFLSYVKFCRFEITRYWRCTEFLEDKDLLKTYLSFYPEAFSEMRKYLLHGENFSCWFYWSNNIPEEWQTDFDKIKNYLATSDDPFHFEDDENDDIPVDNANGYCIENDDEYEDYDESVYQLQYLADNYPLWMLKKDIPDLSEDFKDMFEVQCIVPENEAHYSEDDQIFHVYIKKENDEYFDFQSHFDRIREIIQPVGKGGLPFDKRECVADEMLLPDGTLFDRKAARIHAMAGGV